MSLDTIKEAIAIEMDMRCLEIWGRILDDTDPGHYGVDEIEFQVSSDDLWVSAPQKTFTFKDGSLSFSARLGASSDKDGADYDFNFTVSGSGTFEFLNDGKGGIRVTDFSIEQRLDLFGGDR